MKYIYFLLLTFLFSITGCKDEGTKPQEFSPGYQQDIPWPSLADSPWPMNHHDPQSTGRSKSNGPRLGILENEFNTLDLYSGIVISADSTIYSISSNFGIGETYAFKLNGEVRWKDTLIFSTTTPLITSDNSIIFPTYNMIYCLQLNGKIIWKFKLDAGATINCNGINIGKDGTIYFIDSKNKFNAVSSYGALLWDFYYTKISSSVNTVLCFSPDGKTIYTNDFDIGLTAFDIDNKNIKWTFGKGTIINVGPVVDFEGHIYITAIDESVGSNPFLYSLNENGTIRWYFSIGSKTQPTIDKNGNIFIATDTLYSIDYYGNLRWKLNLGKNGIPTTPLVCDNMGIIYFQGGNDNFTYCVSNDGHILWKMQTYFIGNGSPAIGYDRLFIPNGKSVNILSIK